MDVHRSFGVTAALVAILLAIGLFRGEDILIGLVIAAGLTAAFWWLAAKGKPSRAAVFAGQGVLLLHAAGAAFGLYTRSLAGTTYDTYMHLLAAFALTLLLLQYLAARKAKNAPMIAAGIVFALGVGVEVAQVLKGAVSGTLGESCWHSFCPYWQDTLKDLLNDALGILLALVAKA